MTTNLWVIDKNTNGGFWDVNQITAALSGQNDVGIVQAFAQIAAPGAASVAVNTTAGNLTGNYQYKVAFITGYLQGDPQNPGAGTLHKAGNTSGGTTSATVSPSGQQVNLTNIPVGGTGVVARAIYRTQAGGSTFFFLAEIDDNTTTSWTDNVADASLGAQMPASNTTGTVFQGKFLGDGSQLTNIPAPANTAYTNVANTFSQNQTVPVLISNVAQGTAPLQVASTTKVVKLNVEQVDGYDADPGTTASTIPVRDASGNLPGNVVGNSGTATKLATARTIGVSGDVSGSGTFDGSANLTITTTMKTATTAAIGGVEISTAPASGAPVAVTTADPAYTAIHGGTFVTAGTGIAVAASTNSETVSVIAGTTTTLGGVRISVAPASGDPVALTTSDTTVPKTNVANSFSQNQTAPAFVASGLTGAVAASRYVGATASGAPASGTFAVGDFVIDQTGKILICTVAGTPGTWTSAGITYSAGTGISISNNTITNSGVTQLTAGSGITLSGSTGNVTISGSSQFNPVVSPFI